MKHRKAAKIAVFVFLLLLLAVVILNIVNPDAVSIRTLGVCVGGWSRMPFDSATWEAADGDVGPMFSHGPSWDNRRARMLEDLLAHHLHKGMSQSDVRKLLGKPTEDGGGMADWVDQYRLMAFPRWDQRIVARLLFESEDPRLVLKYHGRVSRLVSWEIM